MRTVLKHGRREKKAEIRGGRGMGTADRGGGKRDSALPGWVGPSPSTCLRLLRGNDIQIDERESGIQNNWLISFKT